MVSVVVPVFNHWYFTLSLLRHLDAQTRPADLIVIVDDGSTDHTAASLATMRSDRLRVITHPERQGVPRAWNDGITAALPADVVLVVNNDIDIPAWTLERFEHYLTVNSRIGALGPTATSGVKGLHWQAMADSWREVKTLVHTSHPPGFCFAFHTDLLGQIQPPLKGPWIEESFGEWWYEDTDFFRRAELTGRYNAVCRDVLIHHYESTTLAGIPEWELRAAEAGKRYTEKWREQP